MRLLTELSLLVAITISPLLVLGVISTGFTPPASWLLWASAISLISGVLTVARLRQRLILPLHRLIDNLYANRKTTNKTHSPELRQLSRAIHFSSAGSSLEVINRIDNLEQALRDQTSSHEEEKLRLTKDLLSLESTINEKNHSASQRETHNWLVQAHLANLITHADSEALGTDWVTGLENLQFLLGSAVPETATGNHNLLLLTDRVIDIIEPLSGMREVEIHVEFDPDCPRDFVMDGGHYIACLLQLLTRYFSQCDESPGLKQLFISISQTAEGFMLTLPEGIPAPNPAIDRTVHGAGASLAGNTLTVQATANVQKMVQANTLTAMVFSRDERVRADIVQRLSALGVTCISEFRNQHLDICLVVDEENEAFLSVKPYLQETTYVLTPGSRQQHQHARWLSIDGPMTQHRLEKVISRIIDVSTASTHKKILLVDDSDINTRLLELQLNELGHAVTTTQTGEMAVSAALKQPFEMIFMDIQLPGIDGLEATKRIRQHNEHVPVIGLTAHATMQEKQNCFAAGMNDVMIKPARMNRLESVILRFLQNKASSIAALSPAAPPGAASGNASLPVFDLDRALANAGNKPELAAELFQLLLQGLQEDLDTINMTSSNIAECKRAVHKLHGAVQYCGVPRLEKAVAKLEQALKEGNDPEISLRLKLLNGEVTALRTWQQDNPGAIHPQPIEANHQSQ